MTVEQLINELEKFPKNLPVLVNGYECGYCDISKVVPTKVKLNVHIEDFNGPHDETVDADTDVVRIVRIENPLG